MTFTSDDVVTPLRYPEAGGAIPWRAEPALHQPEWRDLSALAVARRRLSTLPPLVTPSSIGRLRRAMGTVARRQALVLQAGDCAEAFGTTRSSVRGTVALIDEIAGILGEAAGVPVVRVGRLAGQYAKPRSSPVERVGNLELPSFRGHIVHDHAPDSVARRPDPRRLVQAYWEAAATLQVVRASAAERGVAVWASHEALLLDYEEALVRRVPATRTYYGGSGHLLWLGERTRQPSGPHMKLLAGLNNPVACKLGPRVTVDEVRVLCELLNPDRIPGRLTLISRMGAESVGATLPPLVRAVRDSGHPAVWICDPMHGNTVVDDSGRKTRYLSTVLAEINSFVGVLGEEGSWPGGVHLELTGDDVVECAERPGHTVPPGRSTTLCDPRLNARQSIELSHEMSRALRAEHRKPRR